MDFVPQREYKIQNKQPRFQTSPKEFLGLHQDSQTLLFLPARSYMSLRPLMGIASFRISLYEMDKFQKELKRKSESYFLLNTLPFKTHH